MQRNERCMKCNQHIKRNVALESGAIGMEKQTLTLHWHNLRRIGYRCWQYLPRFDYRTKNYLANPL